MVNTPNAIHRVAVKVMTNGRHHRKSTPSFLQGMCAYQMAHALRLPVSRETATVSAAVKVERGAVYGTGPRNQHAAAKCPVAENCHSEHEQHESATNSRSRARA